MAARLGSQGIPHQRHQGGAVLKTRRIRQKAIVAAEFYPADHCCKPLELLIVVGAAHDPSVRRLEGLIRNGIGVRCAEPLRNHATDEIVGALVEEPADLHVKQSQVDVLAFAGPITMP